MPSSTSSTYLRAFQRARPAIARVTVQITSREPVQRRSSGSVMPVPPWTYFPASTSRPPSADTYTSGRCTVSSDASYRGKRCFVQRLGIVRNMSRTRPPATAIAGVWGDFRSVRWRGGAAAQVRPILAPGNHGWGIPLLLRVILRRARRPGNWFELRPLLVLVGVHERPVRQAPQVPAPRRPGRSGRAVIVMVALVANREGTSQPGH